MVVGPGEGVTVNGFAVASRRVADGGIVKEGVGVKLTAGVLGVFSIGCSVNVGWAVLICPASIVIAIIVGRYSVGIGVGSPELTRLAHPESVIPSTNAVSSLILICIVIWFWGFSLIIRISSRRALRLDRIPEKAVLGFAILCNYFF